MNRARDGKHLFALLNGQPCRDQRPGFEGRFNHQCPLRQTGNESIAFGKVGGEGGRAQWVFTDQQAVLGNAVRQIAVGSGVHPVQACADDSNGDQRRGVLSSALQCAFMGGAVNAQGQSRDHRQT